MALCGDCVVAIRKELRNIWPLVLILLLAAGFIVYRLSAKAWDPLGLAELGEKYSHPGSGVSEGYDGQFAYYIAIDLNPQKVAPHLDVPAYRYQRILYPLLARLLAFGRAEAIPWTLILVNFVAHLVGSVLLFSYFGSNRIAGYYVLIYGLWIGLFAGLGADLYEPLAFALVVAGWVLIKRGKEVGGFAFLGLALFAKETMLPFWLAAAIATILEKKSARDASIAIVPGVAYGLWQFWLWLQFGQMGLTSGGANATSFELIPYAGFFRIAHVSLEVFVLYLALFGTTVILPNLWATVIAARGILRKLEHIDAWALLLNAAMLTFLPYSTFREPLGLLRVASGLVVSVILFSIGEGLKRPLNYGMFWMALTVIAFR
jgi:hypothetical protein